MILSVCIALFIANGSQSDLLSCPLRAAETQREAAAEQPPPHLQAGERGNLDLENHVLGSSDPYEPARM